MTADVTRSEQGETLTDRYVWAVVRSLPRSRRDEVGAELRATIADMVAAHGGDEEAERAALTELGDPRALSVRYDERPHFLIGPEQFPSYVRVVRDVGLVVVPIVAVVAGVAEVLVADSDALTIVGSMLGAAINAVVYLGFFITVCFAAAGRWVLSRAWTLDELPELPADRRFSFADLVLSGLVAMLSIGLIVWQQLWPPITTADGEQVPVLQPELWDFWIWPLLALMAGSVLLLIGVYRQGHWTMPFAIANTVINTVFLVIIGWLAVENRILNPAMLDTVAARLERAAVPGVPSGLAILLVGAALVADSVGSLRAARR